MNGMEMLLKQMGLNPKELVSELTKWQQQIQLLLKDQNSKLARIESKLDALLSAKEIEWKETKEHPQLKQ